MSTVTTLPVSDGPVMQFDAEGGDYKDVRTDDGGASKRYTPTNGNYDVMPFGTPGIPDGATISQVQVKVSAIDLNSNGNIKLGISTDGGDNIYYSSSINIPSNSYAYYSNAWTTNPATGSSWTVDEVNQLSGSIKNDGGAIRYSYIEIEITYSGGSGVAGVYIAGRKHEFSNNYSNSHTMSEPFYIEQSSIDTSSIILLVAIASRRVDEISGITYDGTALTEVLTEYNSGVCGVTWWKLENPSTGLADLVISLNSYQVFDIFAFYATGCPSSDMIDVNASDTGYGTSATDSVTTTEVGRVLSALNIKHDYTITTASGENELNNTEHGLGDSHLGRFGVSDKKITSTGSKSMTWTISSSDNWSIGVLNIKKKASSTSYSLTAETKSLSTATSDTALAKNSNLLADTRGVVLARQDAELLKRHKLITEVKNTVLGLYETVFSVGRKILIQVAGLVLTKNEATFSRQRELLTETKEMSLDRKEAGVSARKKLSGETISLNITRQTATFSKGYTLQTEESQKIIDGKNAGLSYNNLNHYTLTADDKPIALDKNETVLSKNYLLQTSVKEVNITSADIVFKKGYRIVAELKALYFSRKNVIMQASKYLTAETKTLNIIKNNASIRMPQQTGITIFGLKL